MEIIKRSFSGIHANIIIKNKPSANKVFAFFFLSVLVVFIHEGNTLRVLLMVVNVFPNKHYYDGSAPDVENTFLCSPSGVIVMIFLFIDAAAMI